MLRPYAIITICNDKNVLSYIILKSLDEIVRGWPDTFLLHG